MDQIVSLSKVALAVKEGIMVSVKTHQNKINNCFDISCVAEVFVVSTRESRPNTMVFVHHAGHAVEAETVKSEFLDPKSKVRQQETKDLMVTIIE
jgi:hypothetical protein